VSAAGKSRIAEQISGFINGNIIMADSLQIYHNFKIGSNCYDQYTSRNRVRLINMFDVFENRLNSFEYSKLIRNEIRTILDSDMNCIIEGGCGFYTKFLLENIESESENQ